MRRLSAITLAALVAASLAAAANPAVSKSSSTPCPVFAADKSKKLYVTCSSTIKGGHLVITFGLHKSGVVVFAYTTGTKGKYLPSTSSPAGELNGPVKSEFWPWVEFRTDADTVTATVNSTAVHNIIVNATLIDFRRRKQTRFMWRIP